MQEALAMVSACGQVKTRILTKALIQAEEALEAAEVPVGCVFVRGNTVIAKARNRTNELRNVSSSLGAKGKVSNLPLGYTPRRT